jgi:hypothetical protein
VRRCNFPRLRQRCNAGDAAKVHAVDGAAGHDDRATAFLGALIKHVHAAWMQGDRVVRIGPRSLDKTVGNLRLGSAENDASLALPLGLSLAAHRILQGNRDLDIADLN